MRYSEENKTIKCVACGSENGIIKVKDMIVCPKCKEFINMAQELNKNGQRKTHTA